jgi:hypothetical protein
VVPTEARHVARGCLLCDLRVSLAESGCDGTRGRLDVSEWSFLESHKLAGLVGNGQ